MSTVTPLVFTCGDARLMGILQAPSYPVSDLGVIIVVGGPQYRVGSHRQFVLLARTLVAAGYPTFRFDYRGMGDSEGEQRTFEHVAEDIRAAVDAFIAAQRSVRRVVLWGLCDAASAVLMYCADDPRIGAIVLANPWVRTETGAAQAYVQQYYGRRLLQRSFWKKLLSGEMNVLRALREFFATLRTARSRPSLGPQSFIERMLSGLQRFQRPVLILISGKDLTAAEFAALCAGDAAWRAATSRAGVRLCSLPAADHTFSRRCDLDESNALCVRWLNELGTRDAAA